MGKIKVLVRDRNTLVLDEDAKKGDIICLNELTEIDYSEIEQIIDDGKDKVYNQRLEAHEKNIINQQKIEEQKRLVTLEKDYNKQLEELSKTIELLKQSIESSKERHELELANKEKDAEKKYINEIASLKATIKENENTKQKDIKAAEDKVTEKYKNEIELKNKELENVRILHMTELSKKELEITSKKDLEIATLNIKHEKELAEKDSAINVLTRQKASSNVKQIGEDLEVWCNNEVNSYMQNGLFNCEWIKDNKVVKDEDEVKGSKADYIFKIYADETKSAILTSICLDMKDENPNSVNKKSNADYYKTLDKNRIKKNCKYAVLVSTLETEHSSYLPMYRVTEYPDMYVVRPAYLMTFLNMITSLTTKFASLVLQEQKERLECVAMEDFFEEFNKLKTTYLDNPLSSLEKQVNEVIKQNAAIMKASENISSACKTIINNYIEEIKNKLIRFEDGIKKEYRQLDKKAR